MKINVLKPVVKAFDPETYVLDEELKNAVEVAIALNQPILLTGEPGTGKTRLSIAMAHASRPILPMASVLCRWPRCGMRRR